MANRIHDLPEREDDLPEEPAETTVQHHVLPIHPEHYARVDCWCEPYLDYHDPFTGEEVWVHRLLQ